MLISTPYPPSVVISPTFNEPYYPSGLVPKYAVISPTETQLPYVLLVVSPHIILPTFRADLLLVAVKSLLMST